MDLVADLRPVFTVWCVRRERHDVWIFQAEGGAVTDETADGYFRTLTERVHVTKRDFVTLYDFTKPLSNFMPYAMRLAAEGKALRQRCPPMRTVVVCPDEAVRDVMRIIIDMVGGDSPYVLTKTVEDGWTRAFAEQEQEEFIKDDYDHRDPRSPRATHAASD